MITHQGHHQMWGSCEQEGWARWPPAVPPNLSHHVDQPSDAQPPAPTCSRDDLRKTLGSLKVFFLHEDSHEHKPSSPLFPRQDRGCITWRRLTFWHGYQEVEHLLRQVRPNGQDLLLKLGV